MLSGCPLFFSFYASAGFVNGGFSALIALTKKLYHLLFKHRQMACVFENVNSGLVYDALVAKKLICTETKLLRYDGLEICTFAEEISIPNMEEAAINIFKYASHLPAFEEKVIEFLREGYEGAKSTVHKARRGVKGEE